jgi:hypothetical protein
MSDGETADEGEAAKRAERAARMLELIRRVPQV